MDVLSDVNVVPECMDNPISDERRTTTAIILTAVRIKHYVEHPDAPSSLLYSSEES